MTHNKEAFEFEKYARKFLSKLWQVQLEKRDVKITDHFKKKFDLVSEDIQFVGDAKYYINIKEPAAKWSAISEYVWFLEKINATHRFLVFGKDKAVSQRWLDKHRSLVQGIKFYYLRDDKIEELK